MNILQVKKYYPWIKEEWQNKLSLYILHYKKLSKEKTIEDQGIKQVKVLKNSKLENALKSLKPE